MSEYTSKHGIVARSPYEMYMSFVDLRNFEQMLAMVPADKRPEADITADFDNFTVSAKGITLSVTMKDRVPYSRIVIASTQSPIAFSVTLHFDSCGENSKTDFWIDLSADLNVMMKMMLGSKIQEGLDRIIDSLVANEIR